MKNYEQEQHRHGPNDGGQSEHGLFGLVERFVQSIASDLIHDTFKNMVEGLPDMVRNQLVTVRNEVREELRQAGPKVLQVAVPLIVGIAVGTLAIALFLLAAVYGLELVLPAWGAALIVGFVTGIFALILMGAAKQRFQAMRLINTSRPIEHVTRTLKVDVARLASKQ